MDQDGEPVQGAEVLFWGAHAGDAVDWDHPAHTALTDAEGAFALQDTAGRYGDSMDFAIAARRSDRASLFALASWTSEHVDVHGARLVLGDALPISGRVRSATGAPVRARVLAQADCGAYLAWCEIHPAPRPGGAWLQRDAGCAVEPLRLVLNTDDDGRFLLPGLADRWTFIVWADGLPTLHAERDAAADGSPIEIALLAPVALYGSLRDAAGAPVRGARVTYRAAHGHGTVESDDSGAWRLQGVSPALTRLTISCPGYATLCEDLDLALTPRGPHDVVLQPSLALTGMVLDERGSLLTRALVTMAWDGPAGSSSSSTGEIRRRRLLDDDLCSTQERGTFRFDSLAAGRYRVQLIDRQTDSVLGATLANAGESGVCLVQGQGLDLITRVRGRVIDAAGQSRRDVVIDVQAFSDASAQDLVLQSHCSPDEADCFALPDMAPGWLRVTVWPQPEEGMPAPAWTRSRGEPLLTWGPHQVAGGTQQLDLRLDR
ncbi:MAG TPA: carboxypeptidase regulatory-like domain-containing protein [Planctomycetota bacterium]|nr:carboxypeptidase regulatory-like domain-containing protein [Planctomycetota bacterium]